MEEKLMSLIHNRVNDQKSRDCIDMLLYAEHTLEKYLHLGETLELSEANAEAFNPQGQTTVTVHALRSSKNKGHSQGKSSGKPYPGCVYRHGHGKCKAKVEKCKKCGKVGHFLKCVRTN